VELDHDPLEGTHKYKVIRELGRGGMGEVFLAEHVALGSRVVVKLLHAELSGKSTLVDRMRLEAQALARLNHPNIVRVTDFDRTPSGRPYFVMEYLPGHSLAEEVDSRGGVLPPVEAIDIVRQALAGLATAHSKGLVHRDIKLDNLFVAETTSHDGTPARSIKILDFGVAKILDPTADGPAPLMIPTGTGVVVGTPRFFAPEQARGQKLDHRADIYAMGLVLYSLIAGRGPFDEAQNITEMAKAHVLTPPQPPSRFAPQPIPPDLDAAVLRAIQKRPEDRFQSAPEFSAELDRIARTPAAPPAPTQYEAPAIAPAPSASDHTTARLPQQMAPTAPLAPIPPRREPPVVRRYSAGVVIAVLVVASLLGAAVAAAVMSMA
jgi:serine/threonine-protein kinase